MTFHAAIERDELSEFIGQLRQDLTGFGNLLGLRIGGLLNLKHLCLIAFYVTAPIAVSLAQSEQVETAFFKSKENRKSVPEKKAGFSISRYTYQDGTIVIEHRDIVNDLVVRYEEYKNGEPVGEWVVGNGDTLDFNFELKYYKNSKDESRVDTVDSQSQIDSTHSEFIVPKIQPPNPFMTRNYYPTLAKEQWESGVVYVSFVVHPTREIEDVMIVRGVERSLDKLAMRLCKDLEVTWDDGVSNDISPVLMTMPLKFYMN